MDKKSQKVLIKIEGDRLKQPELEIDRLIDKGEIDANYWYLQSFTTPIYKIGLRRTFMENVDLHFLTVLPNFCFQKGDQARGYAALEIHPGSRRLPRQTVFILITLAITIVYRIVLSFTNSTYHLYVHVRSVCMCNNKSVQLYIFDSLFIFVLFVHVAMEQALLSRHIIVWAKFCSVTFLSNFYFVSFLYRLFICRRQRKIRLVALSQMYLYKFFF